MTYALILLGGRGVAWWCVSSSSFFTSLSFHFQIYSPIMHSAVPMFVVGCSSLSGKVVIMVLVRLGVGRDVGGVTGVGMGMALLGGFLGGRILLSPDLWSQLLLSLMTCMKSLNSEILGLGVRHASTWLSALMQLSKQ